MKSEKQIKKNYDKLQMFHTITDSFSGIKLARAFETELDHHLQERLISRKNNVNVLNL